MTKSRTGFPHYSACEPVPVQHQHQYNDAYYRAPRAIPVPFIIVRLF